jgi:pimeloyl-ACP methyl ester carboxylesterase
MHIQVNGVDLEYLDEGSGVPVVFSHGGNSDLRYWEPQRATFAARYRFVTYSRRFHGSSEWPTDTDNSMEAHVADLIEIVRGLQAGSVHLVGFSTSLGLYAALRAPGLLRSLTIIEPNVPSLLEGDPEGEAVLAWWRAENARVNAEAGGDGDYRPIARLRFELINNRGPGTFDSQPEGLRQMWLDNFATGRPGAPPADPLMCEQLAAISLPTLIMAAEYGMPYSRRITDVLARCIPTSRLTVVPQVTHFMSYQEPAVFNEAVLDFLAQC